jgi:hypothetical protein
MGCRIGLNSVSQLITQQTYRSRSTRVYWILYPFYPFYPCFGLDSHKVSLFLQFPGVQVPAAVVSVPLSSVLAYQLVLKPLELLGMEWSAQ